MRQAKVEIFGGDINAGGLWYWRLRAANGKIIADGSERYASRSNAKRAALKAARLMILASIELAKQ